MRRTPITRFRHHAALTVAAVVAFLGAVPLAGAAPRLAPVLLVPLALAVWSWRAGTDADADGLRVRALFGARRLPWASVEQFVPAGGGRIVAVLTDGTAVPLTAVTAADLPRLVAASGHELAGTPAER